MRYKYKFKCEYGHVAYKKRNKPYTNNIRFRCASCGLYMYRDPRYFKKLNKKTTRIRWHERRLVQSGWIDKLEII